MMSFGYKHLNLDAARARATTILRPLPKRVYAGESPADENHLGMAPTRAATVTALSLESSLVKFSTSHVDDEDFLRISAGNWVGCPRIEITDGVWRRILID